MRVIRRNLGIQSCRRKPALRDRWIVVAVDQVVRYARMLGLLLEHLLQDRGRLELVGVGFIGELRGHVERQRIKNRRLRVVGITLRQRFHRLLVRKTAGAKFDLVGVPIDQVDGGEIIALALRLGADHFGPVEPCQRVLRRLGIGLLGRERILLHGHCYSPIRDRTARILLQHGGEAVDGVLGPERVQQCHCAVELFFHRGAARSLKVYFAELFRRSTGRLALGLCARGTRERCDDHRNQCGCCFHNVPR